VTIILSGTVRVQGQPRVSQTLSGLVLFPHGMADSTNLDSDGLGKKLIALRTAACPTRSNQDITPGGTPLTSHIFLAFP
jgi:hypothetical protein